jgi:uncharacterized protein (DUF983 family)
MTETPEKKVRYKVKCMNDKCNNYNQELDESVETCSLCGEPVKRFETKVNPKLALVAIAGGIAAPMLFMWGFTWIMFMSAFVISPAAIILGFISRSKPAIVISFLGLAAFVGLILYYWVLN